MRSTVHSHSRHADALEAAFRWNHKLDGCLARLKAILRNCGRSIIAAKLAERRLDVIRRDQDALRQIKNPTSTGQV